MGSMKDEHASESSFEDQVFSIIRETFGDLHLRLAQALKSKSATDSGIPIGFFIGIHYACAEGVGGELLSTTPYGQEVDDAYVDLLQTEGVKAAHAYIRLVLEKRLGIAGESL